MFSRVGEISYSNSEEDAEEFHREYFPDLLGRIVGWLDEYGVEQPLRNAAALASAAYLKAVEQETA